MYHFLYVIPRGMHVNSKIGDFSIHKYEKTFFFSIEVVEKSHSFKIDKLVL